MPQCKGKAHCNWIGRFADDICLSCGAFRDNVFAGGDVGDAYDEPLVTGDDFDN
ncbi:MAG: hypothetical protein R2800_09980 [Flavipsychrobacter sp.]